jgi:A/G-specific adenine glycosylase
MRAAAEVARVKAGLATDGITAPMGRGPELDDDALILALLHWYDRHRRVLPWRAAPGVAPDPYHVWLSEVMLQQTTVATVGPYFTRFVARFPTVQSLAAAELDTVLREWAGLGYYARARNLHACAQAVTAQGGFPAAASALQALPGIGRYTAAAIAAIAFGQPGIAVDGNVERVLTRLAAIETPLPDSKPAIGLIAARLSLAPAARARASDTLQALFDLGATVCVPAAPACVLCPWRDPCRARAEGIAASLPRKRPRPERPLRFGAVFHATDRNGRVVLRRRAPDGLLGGMMELPGTVWRAEPWTERQAIDAAPFPADWRKLGEVRHVFTHFALRLTVFSTMREILDDAVPPEGQALPIVMRKCVVLGQRG